MHACHTLDFQLIVFHKALKEWFQPNFHNRELMGLDQYIHLHFIFYLQMCFGSVIGGWENASLNINIKSGWYLGYN